MTTYSRKMQAIFHRAQLEAERFESPFLETWHVLLAMVEVPGSVAYLTFTDFEDRIHSEEIETAAVLAMEKRPKDLSESDIIDLRAQSPALEAMLQEAQGIASVTGAVEVGSEHVLMAFLLHKDLMVCRLLEVAGFQYKDDSDKPRIIDLRRSLERNAGLSKQDLKAIHDLRKPKKSKASANFANMMQPPQSSTGELADYTKDLTALAESGNLDPVIGRDEEISRMIQVLSRKTKNNPVLVGEAGVGKTALALGLAQRIASGEVPFELADMRILELDMMSVVAGTRFRGDFEERMNQIIDEIEADGKIILFIDELHTIIGSGSGIDSTLDAANILKPALARGTLHMVGATTQAEYQKHIEKDAALSRRFAKITIEEPSVSEAIDILNGLRSSYEDYHRVTITDAAVETAVKAAHRYLTSKNLPDSAIDLLDEASATVQVRIKKEAKREITPLDEALISGDIGAAVKQYKANQKAKFPKPALVDADQIMQTLSRLSGIPVEKMTQTDSKRYLNLESELHKRVIGQDEAVSAISRAIRRNQSGIRTGKRPIGSFMFLGPTGVGKTTTIAKIASTLKLTKKTRVALITADTYRIAAVEQLKTYANILGIPLEVVYSADEMDKTIDELKEFDLVFVDTAGRSHQKAEQVQDIKKILDKVTEEDKEVYLVLSATTKYKDLKKISEVYRKITEYYLIFTKLDETDTVGNIFNIHMLTGAQLSYATWGQNVPDDIGKMDAQKITKQLLGGNG